MNDVRPDFRLEVFLDAFARQAEALTLDVSETKPDDKYSSLSRTCDCCEQKPAIVWCHDCELWLCEQCEKGHMKIKATRHHTFISLHDKLHLPKSPVIETINIRMCTTSLAECQTAITRCHDGLKQIKAVEAKAVNDCNALRQRCHQQIDRQLDDVEREIKATTRPLAALLVLSTPYQTSTTTSRCQSV